MSRRLRFTEEERPPEATPPKKKNRRQQTRHLEGDPEGVSSDAPSEKNPPASEPITKRDTQTVDASATEASATPDKSYRKIERLEQKSERHKERLDDAKTALPTKKKAVRKRIYDEQKNKAKTKLTFEAEAVPIGEAKWNKPPKRTLAKQTASMATREVGNEIHAKVYEVEHENVGTKAAHRAELLGERAYRSGKRTVRRAYRFHKNRPYRKAARLEMKSTKAEAKLNYQTALREAPMKKSAVSRFLQKRRIKRQYATAVRNAKRPGKAVKQSAGIVGKAAKLASNIVRRNPVFLFKVAVLGLIVLLLMAMFSMCMNMLSGGSVVIGAATYVADYEDIDDAELAYREWTVDLELYLLTIPQNHSGFDEYRFDTGYIGHNPFELMAFLTAVYGDFTFAEVEPTLRALFAAQYQLTLTPEVEIRTRTETWEDQYGVHSVEVEYEWHILNITLTTTPLSLLVFQRMDDEQFQHFNILMQSLGARQFVGNPFAFNWLPHVSSHYGYRIHPIHGDKRFHAGIDISLPTGTEILAGFDGTVTNVGYDPDGYGNFVVIDNGAGIQALYAHCHTVLVSIGQQVSQGDVIATVGNTGASTGAHLHMEVIRHGRRLNPLFFVVTGFEGGGGFGGGQILTGNENMIPTGMFTWPMAGNYPITSPFGWRIHPISGQHRHHNGIDIGAPGGTPILAMADGVVTIANSTDSWGGGWGFFVRIQHEGGFETLYAHASAVLVRPGQRVSQGEVIALVGTTGSSTGNHLHFEVIRNGTPIDPMQFFRPS